jgi:cyclic beta-1,2-glucan synthetase
VEGRAGLEKRAGALARDHRGRLGTGRASLRPDLDAVERSLAAAYRRLAAGPAAARERPAAEEWLLDNDYVIQEALEQVRIGLPQSYYRELPILRSGPDAGLPRLRLVARAALAAAGGPVELEAAELFLESYQETSPLSIGELWAFPALLRLVVLEGLAEEARELGREAQAPAPGRGGESAIGWAVLALRDIAARDWKAFFERASRVERVLRRDPAGAYTKMSFETRDRYRGAVERVARWCPAADEETVARTAIRLARDAARGAPGDERAAHVGMYLAAEGRRRLEEELDCRPPRRVWLGRRLARSARGLYLSAVAFAWALALAVLGLWLASREVAPGALTLLLCLASGPALGLAVAVVHWAATLVRPPRMLPRMDTERGIPEEARTLVVLPVIVSRVEEVETLLARLERHYLGNRDPLLSFGLLTDFADAAEPVLPEDGSLLETASRGIRRLNRRHGGGVRRPFFFLHRERRWNPVDRLWMGWERKRGKLEELNLLLRGDRKTSFTAAVELPEDLDRVRYVLTLDADTQLLPGSAAELVATIDHPLNRPRLGPETGAVTAGYTVLQPRLAVDPAVADRTRFSRILAGEAGLDLYTRAVSDVYHDLFGEAVFAGKGIYAVHAFAQTLRNRVPENALLSHDLFEGIHGRVGLVSDVVLLEDYPPNPLLHAQRLHRWVRGDWQLLPWLASRVPAASGRRIPSALSALDRWKIVDNLRRSLFAPSVAALFAAAWLLLPGGAAWMATAGVAALSAAPVLLGALAEIQRGVTGRAWRPAVEAATHGVRLDTARWALSLTFLAHQSLVTLDAVARTLYRLFVSRRKLLEWTSAAHAARAAGDAPGAADAWRQMVEVPVAATVLAVALAVVAPASLPAAAPLLLLWFLSPQVAAWVGRPASRSREPLTEADRRELRLLSRRTWRFFEELVGPEDHWLPPDHLQEEPGPSVAHRTSPTNVGMLLLSTLAAHDLGYLGARELAERLRRTFESLDRLERHHGHWLNWYDTRELGALEPRYVSTVDSGNLVAALLVVGHGLQGVARGPSPEPQRGEGVADTVAVLRRVVERGLGRTSPRKAARTARDLADGLGEVERDLRGTGSRPPRERRRLLEEAERRLGTLGEAIVSVLEALRQPPEARTVAELRAWMDRALEDVRAARLELSEALEGESGRGRELDRELRALRAWALRAVEATDFAFLFDRSRELFRIGYHVSTGEPDPNHYDLLASEARIASFLAIAKGDVPVEHWLHLGRPVTRLGGSRVLLSWGGTMFEYLMPHLMLRCVQRTLLDESCRVAVERQIAFARRAGIPWGISESGFAELGIQGDYQYRAFGVPGLGLKRDLGDRLVVAPYASVLAVCLDPHRVLENLHRLADLGALGTYGFYEAVDFGPAEMPRWDRPRVVRSYMAHHQGMILVAAANQLLGEPMVTRMHADPRVASVDLLLHEQIPKTVPTRVRWRRSEAAAAVRRRVSGEEPVAEESWEVPPRGAFPRVVPLSNGVYTVLVSAAGGGVSRWHRIALTRHRADPTVEEWGTWIYLKDLESGALWSAALEPTRGEPAECSASFAPHRVELLRRDAGILCRTTIAVADEPVEIRRVRLTNEGEARRRLFVASYAEVALAADGEDRRHPAFSKLFVHSELRPGARALLFHRRARSPEEWGAVLGHAVVARGTVPPLLFWETDRARFLGRGRDRRSPLALDDPLHGLTGTTGDTLDPVLCMGCAVELAPGQSADLVFLTAAGPSEGAVLSSLESLASSRRIEWALEQARSRSAAEARDLGIRDGEMREMADLLSLVLAPHEIHRPGLGAAAGPIEPALWSQGISGDLPILLVRVTARAQMDLVRMVLRAHQWWRGRRVGVDLVLLDEVSRGYDQPERDRLERAVADAGRAGARGPGRVFVVRADEIGAAGTDLLAAARVVLDTGAGALADQLGGVLERPPALPEFVPVPGAGPAAAEVPVLERPEGLAFDNGLGGFSPDAEDGEYVVFLEPGRRPPAPWANVVAHPGFGFLVSESGASCTWAGNSGELRLTPWHNDPVRDPSGEALFLRDEETGEVWSPTPAPSPAPAPYEVRHAPGRSRFLHRSHGLEQELELFVAPEDPVKLAVLRLRDLWSRRRRLTATYYAEWVLGTDRERTAPFVVPEFDHATGALLVRSLAGPAAGRGVAFLAASRPCHGVTADRAEFLGPAGDTGRPEALRRIGLSGAVRPGVDPCGAHQVHLELKPGGTAEVHFLLGMGRDRAEALTLVRRFRRPSEARAAAASTRALWHRVLDRIVVETPDPAVDRMLNRWLPYQAVACRLWARTASHQSSGAYGFRDQLQDAANLAPIAPELAQGQIVRAAGHQFEEGDVLHWWHPDTGSGVRTRCSDDLLWLPWACARYVGVTGDTALLRERVRYLAAPVLEKGEVERFGSFAVGQREGSIYEHCLRAIERGTTRGPHGLPLIGSGDWNDGMNRLGLEGRGESVWLGWFLCSVLRDFAPLCERLGEPERGDVLRRRAGELAAALEEHAWDGSWYRRAFADDGRSVGSAEGEECRIDLIAQAWSVLSGAADPERAAAAMASARRHLLQRGDGLLLLLAPPFERSEPDPGYIRAYPPGVRENGGQYTHAAVWGAWAFAELGDGDLAVELLRMLSPIAKTGSAKSVERYRVEPYVVAADVYGVSPHAGRGGWTWYTGAAAWLWRYGIEGVLGLRRRAGDLEIDPCIARDWPGFRAEVREGDAVYEVRVENPGGVSRGVRWIELDGRRLAEPRIPLRDDGRRHRILVEMGHSSPQSPPDGAGSTPARDR